MILNAKELINKHLVYDFDNDGGVAGMIPMGVFSSNRSVFFAIALKTITTFAATPGTMISVGYAGNLTAFVPATLFSVFVASTIIDLNTSGLLTSDIEVIIVLSNTVTAGKFVLSYFEQPYPI